jgi:hypothetical protein
MKFMVFTLDSEILIGGSDHFALKKHNQSRYGFWHLPLRTNPKMCY